MYLHCKGVIKIEDFDVSYNKDNVTDDNGNEVTVITSASSIDDILKREKEIMANSMNDYSATKDGKYSVYVNETTNNNSLTLSYIDNLAQGIHSTLNNVLNANRMIDRYIVEDGLMGYAYSCIISNINTNYKLLYNGLDNEGKESKDNEKIENIITQFNKNVDIKRFIRDSISTTYTEGNCVSILRLDNDSAYIDIMPLELAYPSDYKSNGSDIIEVDVNSIKSKLQKTYKKTKKNKAVYFDNLLKEVEANFAPEIVKAYRGGEKYARIDPDYADCVKINSLGKKFGVSPFFRALRPLIVLNNLEEADVSDSKARSKKIIYQKLRKDLLDSQYNGGTLGLPEQELAHQSLMAALKTNFCAYTSPAYVESLEFVTAKSNNSDASTQLQQYTSKFLQSLGISFIDNEVGNYSTVKTSVTQLVRTINYIISDLERVINKYYRTVLEYNGINGDYAPTIKIADAEEMAIEVRQELAGFIYGTLNASRETTFNMIGLDLQDEITKRKREDEAGLDEVFSPHETSYNKSGDDKDKESGRPESDEDLDKQKNGENYNKEVR